MKKDVHHKNYRFVVFKDISCDYAFLTKSTVTTTETIKWDDGKEYDMDLGPALRGMNFEPIITNAPRQRNDHFTAGRCPLQKLMMQKATSPTLNMLRDCEQSLLMVCFSCTQIQCCELL